LYLRTLVPVVITTLIDANQLHARVGKRQRWIRGLPSHTRDIWIVFAQTTKFFSLTCVSG